MCIGYILCNLLDITALSELEAQAFRYTRNTSANHVYVMYQQNLIWLFDFAYLSSSCHNMDLVFYQIGPSSTYHPYLVTTQLIGSNALGSEEIPQINF